MFSKLRELAGLVPKLRAGREALFGDGKPDVADVVEIKDATRRDIDRILDDDDLPFYDKVKLLHKQFRELRVMLKVERDQVKMAWETGSLDDAPQQDPTFQADYPEQENTKPSSN